MFELQRYAREAPETPAEEVLSPLDLQVIWTYMAGAGLLPPPEDAVGLSMPTGSASALHALPSPWMRPATDIELPIPRQARDCIPHGIGESSRSPEAQHPTHRALENRELACPEQLATRPLVNSVPPPACSHWTSCCSPAPRSPTVWATSNPASQEPCWDWTAAPARAPRAAGPSSCLWTAETDELQPEIERQRNALNGIEDSCKRKSRHVLAGEPKQELRYQALGQAVRYLMDTLQMLAYRGELDLARQLAALLTHLSKPKTAREVVRHTLFASGASLVPDHRSGIFKVRLLHQSRDCLPRLPSSR